jgi:T4 superinfection immunity protein
MHTLANSYPFWIMLFLLLAGLYLLPTLIGAIRQVDRLALVFLVNLIGAPTGIGWLAALILAFGPHRLSPVPTEWPRQRPSPRPMPGTASKPNASN